MILLDGHSLTKKTWFRPDSQPMNLEERKSTTSLVIGPEAPEIEVGAWLLDDCEPGAGIIWQVKTVDRQVETGMRTIQAEHVITTLRDEAVFGEITAGDIGSGGDVCSAQAAIAYLLSRTELWTLGDFEPTDVLNPYRFTSTNLFSAIETVTGTLEDAYWDYDLTSIPFKLHIRKLGTDCDCEMRMSRNIQTMRISIDRSRMYTRIYPIGYDDLHIPGDYLSRNEAAYGVISRIEQDQSKETVAELTMWAEERLRRHSEPTVTVTIDGYELARETGEELDRFGICAQCRVPVAELGQTFLERVTRLKYKDKIADPERVTVTLANEVEDVASIMRKQQTATDNAARSSGKKSKKKYEEDHAWFVDTTDHVAMVAEAIIGQGPDGVDWSRVATLSVDGYGIHARVIRAEGYLVTLQSEIQQTEERLSGEFVDRIASLRSAFEISAESMRIEFADDVASVRSLVTQTASSWEAKIVGVVGEDGKVTAASIAAAINDDGESEILLSAERIDIQGIVESLDAYDLDVATLHVEGQTIFEDTVYIDEGGLQVADPIGIGPDSNGDFHTLNVADVQIDPNDSNKLIISYVDGTSATFNRAASAHISAGSWSGGVLQINASPGTENYKIGFGGSVTADMKLVLAGDGLNPVSHESNEKFLYLPVKVQQKDESTTPPTFADVYGPENLIIDCTEVWNAGRLSVEPVTPQLSGSWNTGTHILTVTSNPQAAANYTVGFGRDISANEKLVLAGNGLNPVAHETNAKYLYLPVKVQKRDDSTNPPTFTDVYGPENLIVDCSDVWDAGEAAGVITGTAAGKSAVDLGQFSWNQYSGQVLPEHRELSISTSGKGTGNDITRTKDLYLTEGIHATGKIRVLMRDGFATGTEVARLEIDAYTPEDYQSGCAAAEAAGEITGTAAGKSAVDLGQFSWNQYSGTVLPEHRELSISTSGKGSGNDITRTKDLYLTEGIHATGKIRVLMRDGFATGTEVARLEVDAYLPADYQAALATVPPGYVTNVTISPSQDVELAPSGGITAEQTVTVTATDGSGNSTTIGSVKISASGYNATEYEQHAKDTAESAALKFIDWGSISDDDHPITDLYPGSTVAVQYGPEGSEIELAGQRFYVPESSSDPITWAETLTGTQEKRFAYVTHGDETKAYRIAYNTDWKNAGGNTRTAVEVRVRSVASRSDASTSASDPVVARMDIQSYLNNARNAGGQSASIQELNPGKGTNNILRPGYTYGVKYMNASGTMVWGDSWGYVEDSYQNGWDDAIEWANENFNLESHTTTDFYCQVIYNNGGTKTVRLTKTYSATQNVPSKFKNDDTVYIGY